LTSTYEAGPDEEHGSGLLWVLLGMMVMSWMLRILDVAILLLGRKAKQVSRRALLAAYGRMWRGMSKRSPFEEGDFARVQAARAAGLSQKELVYGETPLWTALRALRRAGVGEHSNLLDIGCGRGRVLLASAMLGAHSRGVDVLKEHVDFAEDALGELDGVVVEVKDALAVDLTGISHVFLTWTCMSQKTRSRVARHLASADVGTKLLCVSHPPPEQGWRVLWHGRPFFTWGKADLYLAERSEEAENERAA